MRFYVVIYYYCGLNGIDNLQSKWFIEQKEAKAWGEEWDTHNKYNAYEIHIHDSSLPGVEAEDIFLTEENDPKV